MQVFNVAVPATSQSLYSIVGQKRCSNVALQCPSSNVGDVYWGDTSLQLLFIAPGGSSELLPIPNLESIYVKGTAGDELYVLII